MTDSLRWLYQYVTEHLNTDDPDYPENHACGHRRYQALESTLTPEQRRALQAWQDTRSIETSIESEAIFQRALTLGLELGALLYQP